MEAHLLENYVIDLRIQSARQEARMEEGSRRIEALSLRVSGVDARLTNQEQWSLKHGHSIQSGIITMADHHERIRKIEGQSSSIKRLEVLLPVILVIIALLVKVPIGEISSLIPR